MFIGMNHALNNLTRLLRGCCIVEIDKRLVVYEAMKNRKVFTNGGYVK